MQVMLWYKWKSLSVQMSNGDIQEGPNTAWICRISWFLPFFPFLLPFLLHLVPSAFVYLSVLTPVKLWVSSCATDHWESSLVELSSGKMLSYLFWTSKEFVSYFLLQSKLKKVIDSLLVHSTDVLIFTHSATKCKDVVMDLNP